MKTGQGIAGSPETVATFLKSQLKQSRSNYPLASSPLAIFL
jgi:hypothetical protein